ncbi:ketoacyl-ACP synthase III [Flavobacteriaceae bacterium TP-CH-4]|uniref:Ketoacyl-ACP synthase III n=1 Tax=Pelagihabitans pacificus TaxID=2696054 RepID=A0A967AXA3_9FLAO|nr:ketoacyl-ACP synthase III [Pelagihabitans pacificus]NHF58286.1 ketoacyl-ACP synthase III [Pelagihabitans pacificus]
MQIAITGTGCYIPSITIPNDDFAANNFLNSDGTPIQHENRLVIEKFKAITGIGERRYVEPHLNTSDIALLAAEKALTDANIDKEELDYIILAHNFGDVSSGQSQSDTIPSLASRVKHLLRIHNPKCIAYDLLFGCPGWVEGVIQACAFIKSGMATKCLVIGAETLSRVTDPHDRDSMIYSDGAGAAVIEAVENGGKILSHATRTFTYEEAYFLFYGTSYRPTAKNTKYIKMYGRKIYEFAITNVPKAMKECLNESGAGIEDVKKIFIHQANEKMDEAIVSRFYGLYDRSMPKDVMPMNIHKMGNSSVATIPTLFDMVRKGNLKNQSIEKEDVVIFASVGAGMNINAVIYKV